MKISRHFLCLSFVIWCITIDTKAQGNPPLIFESVLNSGDIYKLSVDQTGVHIINKELLALLKIDVENTDPRNIKLYGMRGGMLPESNAEPRPDDLQELAIKFEGEEDGRIDKNDHIVFYAEGPQLLLYENGNYRIPSNIYDSKNYYFIKVSPGRGKRVQLDPETYTPTVEYDYYDKVERYEKDLTNLLGAHPATEGAGKEWYGEAFKTNRELKLTDKFTLSSAEPGSIVDIQMVFAGRSASSSNVILNIGTKTFSQSMSSVDPAESEDTYAQKALIKGKMQYVEGQNNIVIDYPKVAKESEGWLDYLQLVFKSKITFAGKQFNFRNRDSLNASSIALKVNSSIAPDAVIWDVTDPFNVKQKVVTDGRISYTPKGEIREFCFHRGSQETLTPTMIGKIANQNIHRLLTEDVIIVYYPAFKAEAQKLAQHRSKHSNLEVEALDVLEIYNEFSGGKVDPTAIRDMAKMLFDRNKSFKYLVLLGDGSYDYKGLVRDINPENFIPVYETDESLNPINGFPSDDYYALLDTDEGINLIGDLDISVGRLPAKTVEDAKILINKIIHYETSPKVYGDWKLKVGYHADDQDNNTHIRDMEFIATQDEIRHQRFNQQKVYFDAYKQVSTSGEHRFPDANSILNRNITNGQLSTIYLGHGGPLGWAQERVLTIPDIVAWDNYDAMTIMLTATCSFAAYDDPSILSPAEQAILNPKGGAIALYSTTRSVFTNSNMELTNAVNELLYKKEDGKGPTLGYCLTKGKNKYSGSFFTINSRKFTLLGDPSMSVPLPSYEIVVTKVNNKSAETSDTASAIEFVTLEGEVQDASGNILTDFDGYLYPTIFDKKVKLQTLGTDSDSRPSYPFTSYRNTIFKGKATVTKGKWTFSFYVPKNISYNLGQARISLYATNHKDMDADGLYNGLFIGGPSNSQIIDDKGPEIKAFMDQRSFNNGDKTQTTTKLILDLTDDFGINVTGNAIGQDITAILDGDRSKIVVLNGYYQALTDNYKQGVVEYIFNNLSVGKHTLTAKAWDISGNSTEINIDFEVVDDLVATIEEVTVKPNPFVHSTSVSFTAPPTAIRTELAIFDVTGRLIEKQDVSTAAGKINTFNILETINLMSQNFILYIISRDAKNKIVGRSDGIKIVALY
jgi:hypothetical protein